MILPTIVDLMTSEHEQESRARGVNGMAVGIVTRNNDEEGLGRIKVHFPWLSDNNETDWIRIATMMAGSGRGSFFIPDVEDEVVVAFEQGDINQPIVVGCVWNKEDVSPEKNSDGLNNIKKIKTRSGHEIIFDDTAGEEHIEIHSKSGHQIILNDTAASEKVIVKDKTSENSIEIDSTDGSISISSIKNISLKANTIDISATDAINLKALRITNQATATMKSQAVAIENQATGAMSCIAGGPLTLKGTPISMG
jgi:uncharacterized protein involved in type VI secretion and phage assembly